MERAELLTVKDSFQIKGHGIVIVPDFSVPTGWKDRNAPVVVMTPDGQETLAEAHLNLTHFNLSDPAAPPERRWRVVVILADWKGGTLPVGTRILAPRALLTSLLPE